MSDTFSKVEVITGVARRWRFSTDLKLAVVAETMQPGMSISYVARRHGLPPSLVFHEEVVPAAELRRLEERVRRILFTHRPPLKQQGRSKTYLNWHAGLRGLDLHPSGGRRPSRCNDRTHIRHQPQNAPKAVTSRSGFIVSSASPRPDQFSDTSTRVQLMSGSKRVMAPVSMPVRSPRSFWNTTPSWSTRNVMIPETP
jgi:hypothetical protein